MQRFAAAARHGSRLSLSAWVLALAACGGGGGGGGNVRNDPPPSSPPPTTPPPPSPNQPAADAHLSLTNARAAHSLGLTGQGIRIGVVDSGVRRTHPALAGRVGPMLLYTDPRTNNHSIDDVLGHGTYVSQIAAGTPVGAWPGGIAPGAQIVSARILADVRPSDDGSGQGNQATNNGGLDIVSRDLMNAGVRIMNNSWGGLYWTGDPVTQSFIAAYQPFIDNGGLVVFATGNESRPDPTDNASLPSQGAGASILERGWLAAAALDSNNPTQLASYSNACGIAMRYCLVAPGNVIATGVNDAVGSPTYWSIQGTSFAAPQVSGAAALVWQAFPYFNNDLVRQTLLGNAKDLGAPGVDPVFGYGLLDIGAAVRGPRRFDWGDVRVAFDGNSSWSNPIAGTGGLIKEGSGTLRLDSAAAHSYTGATQVNAGVLRLNDNGALASPLAVRPGAQFVGGAGARIGNRVDNQGALRLEGAGLRVDGDYQQGAGAQLQFLIGSRLDVGGSASLAGGAHVLGQLPGYVRSSREVFLNAGSVSGTFDSLSSAPGVFLLATLGYSGTRAWLDIVALNITAAAQSMGVPMAASAAAQRVDGALAGLNAGAVASGGDGAQGAFGAGLGALQHSADTAQARRSLTSLSGELHTADAAFAQMAIEASRRALESRLDARVRQPQDGAWSERLDTQRVAAGRYDLDIDGWMLGQDRRLGAWTYGAALSRSEGRARHAELSDRERNRQTEAQLYAAWNGERNYLFGRAAFGYLDRELQREIVLGASRFGVGSDYGERYLHLGLQAGRRYGRDAAALVPYVGAELMRLQREGFDEPGALGFGLRSQAASLQATQALAGLRLQREGQWGGMRWRWDARAEWQRRLSLRGGDIAARFTAMEVWAPILGEPLPEEVALVGLGLDLRLPRAGALRLDLDQRYEDGAPRFGAMAWWSYPF
ncbi:S8 family serine peptidase [Lysobacter firmicutimachus]|uniref:S8 family serine peptidase n=1 Tax=Lysobacter firmicutimachus TaxID=1792846 RepID=A0ABU8D381_9GAMM